MAVTQGTSDVEILLNDLPSAESASALLQRTPSGHRQRKSARGVISDHTDAFFRSISLQIVNYLRGWRNASEPPKVVIQQTRSFALTRAFVHILPVVGCITLIALNGRPRFILHYNSWYTILQFVAKVHEVLMQASIATVLLGYIRQQIVGYTAIPFGSLFAPAQITNISYLWSLEFWAVLSTHCLKGWRKVTFALFIFLSALLAASVGPSSAIAMLPRAIDVRLARLVVARDVKELFPMNINTSYKATADLPAIEQYLEEGGPHSIVSARRTPKTDIPAVRRLNVDGIRSPPPYDNGWIASTPPFYTSQLADVLLQDYGIGQGFNPNFPQYELLYDSNVAFSCVSQTKQPYVHSVCHGRAIDGTHNSSFLTFDWATSTATKGTVDNIITEGQFINSYKNIESMHITWLEPSQSYKGNYSVLAILGLPWDAYHNSFVVYACAITATWLPSRINTTFTPGDYGWVTDGYAINEESHQNPLSWPRPVVSIDTDWAESLIDETSITLPHGLQLGTAEPLLAIIVATAMADIDSQANQSVKSTSGFQFFYHSLGDLLEKFQGGYDSDARNPTEIKVELFGSGIGYSAQTFPAILALTILGLYCVFAVSYVVYSLVSGISANSWDTMAEITALALNSKSPDYLGHTSVGLQTVKVFQEPVRYGLGELKGWSWCLREVKTITMISAGSYGIKPTEIIAGGLHKLLKLDDTDCLVIAVPLPGAERHPQVLPRRAAVFWALADGSN